MRSLSLPSGPLSLLCLGAHADDLEIGCGGSVLRLLAEHPGSAVRWVVFSAAGARAREAQDSAKRLLDGMPEAGIAVHDFRDGYFPAAFAELKDQFETLQRETVPDLIFTHRRSDAHQDHRTLAELTHQTFRSHLILEYEILKYDGDLRSPNVFVPLPEELRRRKLSHLLSAFPSQAGKHWYAEATFLGLMRLRGVECAAAEGYAEAFHCSKLVLGG